MNKKIKKHLFYQWLTSIVKIRKQYICVVPESKYFSPKNLFNLLIWIFSSDF